MRESAVQFNADKPAECPSSAPGLHLCYQLCGFILYGEAVAEGDIHEETLLEGM